MVTADTAPPRNSNLGFICTGAPQSSRRTEYPAVAGIRISDGRQGLLSVGVNAELGMGSGGVGAQNFCRTGNFAEPGAERREKNSASR